jgi:(S)-sulfolactate dehydrogenase
MIVISEFMSKQAVAEGLKDHRVLYDPTLVDRPDDLAEALRQATGLIVRNRTQVRGALLEAAPRLKVVGRLGVGLDNIDMDACETRGVKVYPASGANDVSVAEYVLATAMVLLRGAYFSTDDVASGGWPRNRLTGREISGKVLGLVGYGSIARETARRAVALGMDVVAYDPFVPADAAVWAQPWGKVSPVSLEALLATADVVSLHVPLTAATRGMIGPAALAAMKPGAIVINAARGGVVDEAALIEALRAGKLGGAALDVFDAEPLTSETGAGFRDVPNLILTPHIAGVTQESNERVSWLTVRNVARHLKEG